VKSEESKTHDLISAGSEILGSTAGAAITLLLGPGASIAGAALSPLITRVLKRTCVEFYDRQIGQRQKIRAGATAGFAIVKIKERLDSGFRIRDDGFFNEDTGRSSAEEIFEGVVIKSHNEHEEKKAKYYANIFAMAAFDSRFTTDSLNHYLSLAEELTYRQLCLLQLFNHPHQFDLLNAEYDSDYLKDASFEKLAVLHEMYGLYQLRLLKCQAPGNGHPDDYMSFDQIHPSWMSLNDLGKNLNHLMQLQTIPHEDLATVAMYFKT
jgi:hypothetical protein